MAAASANQSTVAPVVPVVDVNDNVPSPHRDLDDRDGTIGVAGDALTVALTNVLVVETQPVTAFLDLAK